MIDRRREQIDGHGVVFWDFDGTLAFRDGLWRASLITALDEVAPGHRITRDAIRAGLQDGQRLTFPWHRPAEPHEHLSTAELWWAALTPLLTHAYARVGVPLETATEAVALVPRVYTDPRWWTVFPDTVPALTAVRAAGWRTVILSNHVPELPALVRDLGLDGLFDDVIFSAQTGFEKPHPRMYAAGLDRAGRPAIAWMVGDNPVADVQGARAAGMRAILVRHEPGADLTKAARKIISG